MAILWLASFPKSGNTWMRAFLVNYLADGDKPVDLEGVRKFAYSDAEAWPYCDNDDFDPQTMPVDEFLQARPKAHARLAASNPDHVVVKTHNAYRWAQGFPLITASESVGAIQIVRNPWDVAVSYADHFGKSLDETIIDMANPGLAIRPHAHRMPQPVGSWSHHTESWEKADIPVLTIRYEDMLTSPHGTFGKVIAFLKQPADPDRVARAIQFSRFEQLARLETETGFVERSDQAEKFFRKGEAGGWRDVLSTKQARRIAKDHRTVARKLGYLTSDGRILVGGEAE